MFFLNHLPQQLRHVYISIKLRSRFPWLNVKRELTPVGLLAVAQYVHMRSDLRRSKVLMRELRPHLMSRPKPIVYKPEYKLYLDDQAN